MKDLIIWKTHPSEIKKLQNMNSAAYKCGIRQNPICLKWQIVKNNSTWVNRKCLPTPRSTTANSATPNSPIKSWIHSRLMCPVDDSLI